MKCKNDSEPAGEQMTLFSLAGSLDQPYSAAGKRLGKEDERHLWPEMLRVIREVQPRWVVGENVLGLVNWNGGLVFEEVQADLEAEGYEVQPFILPAASVNAPHKRDRVWFVAYADRYSGGAAESNVYEEKQHIQCRATRFGIQRPTPDTDSNRGTQFGESIKSEGEARNLEEQGEWIEHSKQPNELFGLQRNATDTASEGLEGRKWGCSERKRPSSNSEQNATDTNNQGLQGGEVNGSAGELREESHELTTRFVQPTWDNFPTQSPICSRTNGFQTRLDSITFSKWRNESIKAAGNAIVPQVVFQIFKAINEYREKYP